MNYWNIQAEGLAKIYQKSMKTESFRIFVPHPMVENNREDT